MALITDKVVLNPKATASAPTGSEGSLYYDSDEDTLKQYGTSWKKIVTATVTGGAETTYGIYKVHTITSNGSTLNVTGASLVYDILIVAGGGGGGEDGSGGGAGGLRWLTAQTLVTGTHTIYVGSGGTGGVGNSPSIKGGNSGVNSTTTGSGLVATGGGRGGNEYTASGAGGTGGSGGGGGYSSQTLGTGNEGGYSPTVEGYNGGSGSGYGNQHPYPSGGGGGAGGLGGSTSSATACPGGVGEDNFINQSGTALGQSATTALLANASAGTVHSSVRYIAGGGGGSRNQSGGGAGGFGGGGAGGGGPSAPSNKGLNATDGTGGGGGAGAEAGGDGGDGGNGIVIIRYAL